jgi:hypothetical protein
MVAHHVFGERLDFLVAGFGQRLLGRRDVDDTGAAPLNRLTAAIAALIRRNMV